VFRTSPDKMPPHLAHHMSISPTKAQLNCGSLNNSASAKKSAVDNKKSHKKKSDFKQMKKNLISLMEELEIDTEDKGGNKPP
jgi:predicted ATP-grasp superfamily ATP-dependent carboligase